MLRLIGLAVLFACNGVFGNDSQTDTKIMFPSVLELRGSNTSSDTPPVITMNGHHNYHAAQQIFYLYGPQWWKMRGLDIAEEKAKKDGEYVYTPGIGAHKLHVEKLTWNKARRYCIDEGGHLAIINSVAEEKVLLSLLADKKKNEGWLGLHDIYEEGDWVTVLDQGIGSTGYSRWSTKFPNNPDNYGGDQNCAMLIKEGGMDDNKCTVPFPFFCEISLTSNSDT